jgi:hypothetical protein
MPATGFQGSYRRLTNKAVAGLLEKAEELDTL